jgi:hypothetical protein
MATYHRFFYKKKNPISWETQSHRGQPEFWALTPRSPVSFGTQTKRNAHKHKGSKSRSLPRLDRETLMNQSRIDLGELA